MSCELCGGGDAWIKTCLTPEGSRLLVCDECYEENTSVLWGEHLCPGDRAGRQSGDGQVRLMLVLRQPQGVRGGQTRRPQERLLGDVR
jgi:ribosome-binding protein aMBF1 (putative translation factor)